MTDLRTAAQQALKILELEGWGYPSPKTAEAITALKAALIEDAMQKFTDVNQELEAALAEPVQEPYCYVYEYDSPHGLHREFYPREYNGMKPTRTVQVYAAPPQRKPLTEEEIWRTYKNLWMFHPAEEPRLAGDVLKFARAIERAHGVGGDE